MIPDVIEQYELAEGLFDILKMPHGTFQARLTVDENEGRWLETDGTLEGARKSILDYLDFRNTQRI